MPTSPIEAWARREAMLLSFLAAAAGVVVLAEPLDASWLRVAGGLVAAVGAVLRVVIAVKRAALERDQEHVRLARYLRVAVASFADTDPTLIGVDPAAQTILEGDKLPAYIARTADAKLREVVAAALAGRGCWLVVVVGASKVGKSRTLFEALGSLGLSEVQLVAPTSGDALRSLLDPAQGLRLRAVPTVLWLDDLEPFLNQGVTLQTLREWHDGGPSRIVVATYGGKGSEKVAGSGESGLATIASEVLQHATEVHLEKTTEAELGPLRSQVSEAEYAAIVRHGLAAYLVAGPALERKLTTGRHAPGEPELPEGVALVYAAVDWARCGRTDPISEQTLRRLWPNYLPKGVRATDQGFDGGLEWALRPVAGTIALLQGTASYKAYGYVVRLVGEKLSAQPPGEQAWTAAIETAADAQASAVAQAAYNHSRLEIAVTALGRAWESSSGEVASLAGINVGVVLGKLGRPAEAVAAYDEVVARFGQDPNATVREMVAEALVSKGVVLGELDRPAEAVAAYDEVVATFGEDPSPALRERVAIALFRKGVVLEELDQPAKAVAAYDEVVARFGQDPNATVREQVARALVARRETLGRTS